MTRRRLAIFLGIMSLLFLLVAVRIGYLTLVRGEELTLRGVRQWTREGVVTAYRGEIQDRNGQTLSMSATAYIVTVNPKMVKDADALARTLAPVLNVSEESILQKAKKTGLASVIVKRQVSRRTVDTIRGMMQDEKTSSALYGISFDEDVRRWYPKGAFLSQVLGLVNVDSVGQSGLELLYEDVLQGTPGSLRTESDARGRLLPDGKTVYVPAQSGNTLRLTIDASLQGIVEKAMRECMEVNNASRVQCIMMDVNTGEILALCMKPDYDPNDPPRNDGALLQELMRITAVTDVYEPGSTFKILTCAAALDCGAANVHSPFTCTGSVYVDGDRIRCWKNSHGHQTLKEGLANSCNPVFVNLALRMGKETLYKYLTAFGLGQKTGIELTGESAGILIGQKYVKDVDLARIGFGQSVAVTPLQLICAASSVVNGGRLMKPYIVKETLDREGNVLSGTHPTVVSVPISEETSRVMRELLLNVVENGGGKNGAVGGYQVGGKTGTAQVYKNGRVVSDVHIGSFIGFAPMDAPQVAVLVTVHEAQVPVDYGSTTAAPFARQILEEALPYLHVKRAQTDEKTQAKVPDVVGLTLAEAKAALNKAGLYAETDGEGQTVTAQSPYAGALLQNGGQVMLYTYEKTPSTAEEMVLVPDVTGCSIVEAGRLLRLRGLEMNLQGSGLAVSQHPPAGTYTAPGKSVTVTFELPGITEE